MAAARRPIVLDFVPRVASPERNRAAVPGVAGRDSRPRAAHQAVKMRQSLAYARRVPADFSISAKVSVCVISASARHIGRVAIGRTVSWFMVSGFLAGIERIGYTRVYVFTVTCKYRMTATQKAIKPYIPFLCL
jgi:hypothetical protein